MRLRNGSHSIHGWESDKLLLHYLSAIVPMAQTTKGRECEKLKERIVDPQNCPTHERRTVVQRKLLTEEHMYEYAIATTIEEGDRNY